MVRRRRRTGRLALITSWRRGPRRPVWPCGTLNSERQSPSGHGRARMCRPLSQALNAATLNTLRAVGPTPMDRVGGDRGHAPGASAAHLG